MTRTEFEEFLARIVWRTGDVPFESDLQYLIRMGEARLGRDLHVQQRIARATLTADDYRIPLPADMHEIRTLSNDRPQVMTYVSPHEFEDMRARTVTAAYYTITDMLEVAEPNLSPTSTRDFDLSYYTTLPPYTDAETWVQIDFFDLYTHACLIYTAPYLQDDQRLAVWQSMYAEMLESARSDDAARKYNGSPLKTRLPGVVA